MFSARSCPLSETPDPDVLGPKMHMAVATVLTPLVLLAASRSSASPMCTLIVDAVSGNPLVRNGTGCDTRVTPASTFKLAISAMGFDSGILVDAEKPSWPYRTGYPDWAGDAWRRDINPTTWIKSSVFWYSQQVAKELGQTRFEGYVKSFGYGNADVTAVSVQNPGSNGAWVMSSLQISPGEQIAFLRKLANGQLPISARALEMTARITLEDGPWDGWSVHGKTGTGSPGRDNRYRADQAYGWYVGWATKSGQSLVFAHLIQDKGAQSPNAGLRAREQLLQQLAAAINSRR